MARYGIGYMGSKNSIAEFIISKLPSGKRFVDLFGGGFAMCHCALLSGKYESVYYNEINPLLKPLIQKAINGEYSYKNFKPEFIMPEKFKELKEKDGYIKYCWSFGNAGKGYLFGKHIIAWKKALFNAIFGDYSEFNKMGIYPPIFDTQDIAKRRTLFRQWVLKNFDDLRKKYISFMKLNLNIKEANLQRLQNLERLERLERIELNTGSYLDYKYQDGDVVYCDPPYENTVGYTQDKIIIKKIKFFSNNACNGKGRYYTKNITETFNHSEFYKWVKTRPYQVFFSSYEISDDSFLTVYKKEKYNLMQGRGKKKKSMERLYTNKPYIEKFKQLEFCNFDFKMPQMSAVAL